MGKIISQNEGKVGSHGGYWFICSLFQFDLGPRWCPKGATMSYQKDQNMKDRKNSRSQRPPTKK